MRRHASRAAVLAALVVTPMSGLCAQTNPWYVPPQPSAPAQQINPYQQPALQAPAYQPVLQPQYGLGAGYTVQPPQPPAVVPQQQLAPSYPVRVYPNAQAGLPAGTPTTGAIATYPSVAAVPSVGTTTDGGIATYQAQPIYQQPAYQQPAYPQHQFQYQTVPQYQQVPQAYQQAPLYPPVQQTYQPQVFGNYPPLGSDPTQKPAPPQKAATPTAPAAPGLAPQAYALSPDLGSQLLHPGFIGPTTLTPGLGGLGGGFAPGYPAPLGASPYLGLPY